MNKLFIITSLIVICSITGFSQMINLKANSDYNNLTNNNPSLSNNNFSLKDLKDIKDFKFKKRRFANVMMYLECGAGGGGNGTELYSFYNFELVLESKSDHMFTGKIGGGVTVIDEQIVYTIPFSVNFLFGELNHFEIGFGAHYSEVYGLYPAGNIGFRHQPARGGFMYKFVLTPHFPREDDIFGVEFAVIKLWAGFGVGWCW